MSEKKLSENLKNLESAALTEEESGQVSGGGFGDYIFLKGKEEDALVMKAKNRSLNRSKDEGEDANFI